MSRLGIASAASPAMWQPREPFVGLLSGSTNNYRHEHEREGMPLAYEGGPAIISDWMHRGITSKGSSGPLEEAGSPQLSITSQGQLRLFD
jgi:hypothetical protein